MRKARAISLIIAVLFLFVACATTTGTNSPTSPLSKEKKFINSAKSFYVSQYKDYEFMTADPSKLTEEQKQILRVKYDVLNQVKPLLDAYSAMVDTGQTPSFEQEQAITQLLNKIGGGF